MSLIWLLRIRILVVMINMSDMSKSFPSSIVLRIDFQVLSIQFYSLIVIKGIF